MSKQQFKPLYAQLADTLIAELKAGTSPFQKPVKENGMPAFVKPVNPITGKGYTAMNALNLALKGHDDPRWMSLDAAGYAKYKIKEGAKGTLINFPKNSEIQAVRTPEGEKIKGEDGKTLTKVVEFEKTQNGTAFLFNASQINGIPPLDEYLKTQPAEQLQPLERAEKLIADSKAVIIHGGQEAFYDRAKDEIHLPEKNQFETETRYYQTAIHQLAHWTGHESRLDRPMEGKFGSMDYAKEELRAAVASMLIGAELKTGHHFGQHAAYAGNWVKLLKDNPFQISRASSDAQKIANLLLDTGQKREVKAGVSEQVKLKALNKGDVIPYKNATYEVLAMLKGKTAQVLEQNTGNKFKVGPKDKLYASLIEAKNNPGQEVNREKGAQQDIARDHTAERDTSLENAADKGTGRSNTVEKGFNLETEIPEEALAEENTASYKMKR
jgi:antirestriction protein ArdC